MADFIQVLTTVDSRRTADRIAAKLLASRLAGCVQVCGPIHSSYWWNEKIRHAREWLCIIKARTKDYPAIEASIKEAHPYDVPEVLAFSVQRGNADYQRWLRRETARRLKTGKKTG